MPAAYQGTVLRSTGQPILNLLPASGIDRDWQRDQIDTINALNAQHLASRPGYSELQARIRQYELAFQLQSTAPAALDFSQESQATRIFTASMIRSRRTADRSAACPSAGNV